MATSVLRKVRPSKMWWAVAMTSKSLWLPAPSKIASPSPAALMVIGFSAVPFRVRDKVAGEGRGQRVDVVQAIGAVQAGMDQDGVAGLCAFLPNHAPIAEAGAVVGVQDAGEVSAPGGALVVGGIHVESTAGGGGLGFGAGSDLDGLGGLAGGAVWAR